LEVLARFSSVKVCAASPNAGEKERGMERSRPVMPSANAEQNLLASFLNSENSRVLEETLQEYLRLLDTLAFRLADERLHLTEQCERLAAAQVQWEKKRSAQMRELEDRSRHIGNQERVIEKRLAELHQQQIEGYQKRQTLEGWQARLTVQSAAWKGERERLLAQLHALEAKADRLSAILDDLPSDWKERHRQGDNPTVEKHREARAEAEYVRLRQELQSLRSQNAAYENQLAELSAEVERLAGFLLEEEPRIELPRAKAA
jgi:predicted  nucleic acid-binding Zn-ribbon protein